MRGRPARRLELPPCLAGERKADGDGGGDGLGRLVKEVKVRGKTGAAEYPVWNGWTSHIVGGGGGETMASPPTFLSRIRAAYSSYTWWL